MEALLRIRTKDGSEVVNDKLNAVISNKKPQLKPSKALKSSKTSKSSKALKSSKAPKGVSDDNNGDFAKFTPIKTPTTPIPPIPWEDESVIELASVVDLGDDDEKFETEDDIFTKQDREWHELMKESDTLNNDDASSDIDKNDDDTYSEVSKDDANSEMDCDDNSSDVSYIDSIDNDIEDCNVFYNVKESKADIKTRKIYSGIPIDFDDD